MKISSAPLNDYRQKHSITVVELARIAGVSERTVSRWANESSGVSEEIADQVAVRLGLTPYDIWGDDWYRILWCRVCLGPRDSTGGLCLECAAEKRRAAKRVGATKRLESCA